MMETLSAVKGRRALVLGGGIAGLAACGVLARHFEQVTLVERDRYLAEPGVRPHTPHGAHIHVLLAGGLVTLSKLVPELPAWLDELGLPEGDLTHHTRVAFEGRWLPRARSGIPIRTCTRGDVEHLLRRDAARRSNVCILDNCKVEGLVGRERVRAVRVTRGGAAEELTADLVVDALGRGSPTARWLHDTGLPAVDELTVDAGIVYTSAWFDPPVDIADDWTVLATLPSIPHNARMGVMIRFGSGRMLCSFIEYGKPKPPRTIDTLIERFSDLCVPELHRLLQGSKPTSEIAVYGNTQNRWRRYGRLPWFPDGLVIIGDAACSLNPRYGQGMTVASLGVAQLDRELSAYFAAHGNLDGFSHHFHKKVERTLTIPWQIALMEDRAWVAFLSGAAPSLALSIALGASQRVLKTAFTDVETYIRFMRVAHLLENPMTMLAPRTLTKIALGGGVGRAGDDAPGIGTA